ncbi:prepilin-type N-terminal cleavage/methylation domain-containing protein [Hyphobacterium sp.]|uniref:prepilin-type N-terminal cleavage/methylation domain-containing protein n=1 Tax=Hyphobacterium sp. TaxID=2004662 RepID=UPI003BAAF4BA
MKRGFTLAEMLIALALTALAIGIISEGVRRSLDFQNQLMAFRTEREDQSAALEAVRSRLERLLPAIRTETEDGESGVYFIGQPDRLVFLSADPGYPSRAGVYEYRMEIVPEDGESDTGPALIVSRRSLTDLDRFNQPDEAWQSWTLPLSQSVSFGYAEAGSSGSSSWQSQSDYPGLITLVADGAEMPSISIPLPQAAPETEAPDPGSENMAQNEAGEP